ncbi:hypothetical protein BJP40_11480 [Streptomyces sp. CC53]|uniref:hypothetical protein n=1 Tax=unclassified Streptomyces TaxID=2593676 RepID=UPI0008DDDFDA|nr:MULTISPECIES: hypothetical protein [unclassified Streptomyces]OII60133.1 hypothetical protein BJP40_11480 [Streptomyces sp. CC53]
MYGTGGPPGSGTAQGTTGKSGLLALLRSWAVALVVLAVTEYVQITHLRPLLVGEEGPGPFGAGLLLVQLPDFVCVALAAWVAGRVHAEPFRRSPRAHRAAVFAVPALAAAASTAVQWGRVPAVGLLLSGAVTATGAVTGYLLNRLQEGDG